MPKNLKRLCLVFLALIVLWTALPAQAPQRYFDTAEIQHKDVRLVVCFPSVGTIRAIAALRNAGVLNVKDLTVIGVYHTKELTNYQDAKNYAETNGLGWFNFHEISADLSEPDLFKKNACTRDFETIFKSSDGIIFFGGPDIPPSVFNQKTSLLTQIEDPYRHYMEVSFVFHLLGGSQDLNAKGLLELHPNYPVLGICLGFQTLNVGTGGTLFQDLWADVYHKMFLEDIIALGPEVWHKNPYVQLYPQEQLSFYSWHSIKLDARSKLRQFIGFKTSDRPFVSSSHHQALDTLGKGLWISGSSLDGKIAEVVEHNTFPNVLGVQFHPERFTIWEGATKFRFTPRDKEPTTLMSFLESHPPSLEFHKKIWSWLSQRLQEFHAAQ